MPLELGNLNRRRFFAGIAGAGASWLGRQALSAAEAIEAPGGTWALLSDTHIPADLGERHRGSCMAENAGRIVTEILSRDSGTAGVIDCDGDAAGMLDIGVRYLSRQTGSLGGGTSEMARNVIGERILGLPREPAADRGVPFNQVKRNKS